MKQLPLISLLALLLAAPIRTTAQQCTGADEIVCEFNTIVSGCNDKARMFIRAAFHESGTYDQVTRTGGSDGSLQYEIRRTENAPVQFAVDYATTMAAAFGVSVADTIMLGAVRAVIACGGPSIPFRFGRIDAKEANPAGRLPSANSTWSETRAKMVQQNGLSVDETVALIGGGHSVARHLQSSLGLDTTPEKLDNRWFIELLQLAGDSGLIPVPVTPATPLVKSITRLESDSQLLKDADFYLSIQKFAADGGLFYDTFQSAFLKLTELGSVFAKDPVVPERKLRTFTVTSPPSTTSSGSTAGSMPSFVALIVGLLAWE